MDQTGPNLLNIRLTSDEDVAAVDVRGAAVVVNAEWQLGSLPEVFGSGTGRA